MRICLVAFVIAVGVTVAAASRSVQIMPLTYPELVIALRTRLPNKAFRRRSDLIAFLIDQVSKRRVDKPLTESWEDDLRQAGATPALIKAIKLNSPVVLSPQTVPPVQRDGNNSNAADRLGAGNVRRNSLGIELVWIPSGKFMMGSDLGKPGQRYDTDEADDDERPLHRVFISNGFWLGKYEVTQAQYMSMVGENPSFFKDCQDCPVESVSHTEAAAFVARLNDLKDGFEYSLPTEAQWEYAARARTTGSVTGPLKELAWFLENADSKTKPVGTRRPNAFGLYDMLGNVAEWCSDWYESYEARPVTDPMGPDNGEYRVLRGGSWATNTKQIRLSFRLWDTPGYRNSDVGFRVVARAK